MRPRSGSLASLGSNMVYWRSPERTDLSRRDDEEDDPPPRRSASKNSTMSNTDLGARFAFLQEDSKDKERRSASKESVNSKFMEGVAKSKHCRARKEYVLGKLMHPKVHNALDRLVNEMQWNRMTEKHLFDKLDENGDGVLSKAEVQKGLRSMGITLLPSELDAVLRTFDSDGNGTIDFDEFFSLLQSHAKELGLGEFAPEPQPEAGLIHGFKNGARVKSKVSLPNFARDNARGKVVGPALGPELDRTNVGATVVGFGSVQGTVRVRFDMSSGTYDVKAEYLVKIPEKEKFGSRRRATIE